MHTIHHAGELAFYEGIRWLVPIKVTAVREVADESGLVRARIDAVVTSSRGPYERGEIMQDITALHVLPRRNVLAKRGSFGTQRYVLPYEWKE